MIRVLVVDDSAVVRAVASAVLSQEPDITVAAAADPYIAMSKMKGSRPDVLLLDLEMPRMDGLTFLRKLMAEDPLPVVVCSAAAGRGTRAAVRAMEEGAVAVVAKPRLGVRDFLHESAVALVDAVRGAAAARVCRRRTAPPLVPAPRLTADAVLPRCTQPPALARRRAGGTRVVALGASTGGTEALRAILEALPADAPPVLVVQHMPEGFTRAFAERLDQTCAIEVKEAADGDRVRAGRALIAPGNRHLVLVRGGGYAVQVREGPLVSRHRPSVDVLFRSVAQAAGPEAVGALLTGMGDDGAEGLLEMRRAGAFTFAQDEASCVVFGMPREAIARGAAAEVVPLSRLAVALLRRSSEGTSDRPRAGA